ncbi:MAG: biotin--[acetyl-CoA-carboxylase] ligase [Oleiphilus sp.]
MDINKLLLLLSDGKYHSGSELGELLGVSRTSIWKCLPQLHSMNVPIESLKGKGYRVPGGLDLLNKKIILESLPESLSSGIDLEILLSCSSTNDYLSQRIVVSNAKEFQVCLAELQTSGRGRRGRAWVSPFGKNIALSLGFVIEGGVDSLSGLSIVVGLAIAKALEALGVKNVGLKWPNDIYVNNKKIAGILVELSGEATTRWNVICGIGLNVLMSEEEGRGIDQAWTSLSQYVEVDRNEVVVQILRQLILLVDKFKMESFEAFISEWSNWDILLDKDVKVEPGGLVGRAKGINAQGALVLDVSGQKQLINAGEVSVRVK